MQTNLLWTGIECHSMENCLAEVSDAGAEITSTIIGMYQRVIYRVEYLIRTNEYWETVYFEINCRHSDQKQIIKMTGDGKGKWIKDGIQMKEFEGCIDIDIPLTPFTNTLPVNRLRLDNGQSREIRVIYLDILRQDVRPARQSYSRLGDNEYRYQNVPNDFEAVIRVDDSGFVTDYPSLFMRTAALRSNYR